VGPDYLVSSNDPFALSEIHILIDGKGGRFLSSPLSGLIVDVNESQLSLLPAGRHLVSSSKPRSCGKVEPPKQSI
jgi:hypothetical protein